MTRRNRRSSIYCRTYPVGKVRPEGLADAGEPAAVPAIRWSVASSSGGHGSGARRFRVLTRDDGSRTFSNRRRTSFWVYPRVVSGMDPSSSVLVVCGLAQERFLPEGGGDEETRTPDPLLAKEMLCQLSYVPIATRRVVVGVSGLEPETSALSGQCSNQLS